MLFNFNTKNSFFPKKNEYSWAIMTSKIRGPWFGAVCLVPEYEPFNQEYACFSHTSGDFGIPRNSEGINMLTNKMCNDRNNDRKCYFTIS